MELIIVITILAILSVSAFLVVSQWIGQSRDSRRQADLGTIQRALEISRTTSSSYPMPDSSTTITAAWNTISYQWLFGDSARASTDIKSTPKDPLDNEFYVYAINANKDSYQVLGYLENKATTYLNSATAADVSTRNVVTKWNSVGILLDNTTNALITTTVDVATYTSTTVLKAVLWNWSTITSSSNPVWWLTAWGLASLQFGWNYANDLYDYLPFNVASASLPAWYTGSLGKIALTAVAWVVTPSATAPASNTKLWSWVVLTNGLDIAWTVDHSIFTKDFTFSVYINPTQVAANAYIFSWAASAFVAYVNTSGKVVSFLTSWSTQTWLITSSSSLSTSTLYQLTIRRSWTNFDMFINGVNVWSATLPSSFTLSSAVSASANFWSTLWATADSFVWRIDDFRFYTRALSNDEVLGLYNATK